MPAKSSPVARFRSWLRRPRRQERRANKRRCIVESFTVAPELLGLALAPPWRRALAFLIDLALIVLLIRAGGVLVGLAAAAAFFVIAARGAPDHWLKRRVRVLFAVLGAFVLFVTVMAFVYVPPIIQVVMQVADLPADVGSEILGWFTGDDPPASETEPPGPAEVAEVLERYATAWRRDDQVTLRDLEPRVEELITGPALGKSQRRIELLETEVRELRSRNLELVNQRRGFLRLVVDLATDLGVTFSWSFLYFTLFPAWGKGRTPGKRLLRLRVVALDNQPLGLWGSFERFAGYTTGLATGLFGFLQIFWDANRQAIHDKIAGTVVVVEGTRSA